MNLFDNFSLYNTSQPSNLLRDGNSLFSTQFQQPSLPRLDVNSQFIQGIAPNIQSCNLPQIDSYLQHISSQNQREQYRIFLQNEIMKLDGSISFNQQPSPQSTTLNFKNEPNLLDLLNIQQKQLIQLNPQDLLSQFNDISNLLKNSQLQQQQLQQSYSKQQQIQQLLESAQLGQQTTLSQLVPQNNTQLFLQQQQQPNQSQQNNFLINGVSEKKLSTVISESNSQTRIIAPSLFSETTIDTPQSLQQQSQPLVQSKQQQLIQSAESIELERKRQIRLEKIEKYKNKRRNWRRKISYDCRKKVADQRLRIKGRFISKKDTEKIKEIIGSSHSEAFNAKKNLRLDFMDNKMRQSNIELNHATSNYEILSQIEELLKRNREIHNHQTMQSVIKRIQKKQLPLFCFVKRQQANMIQQMTNESEESQNHSSATDV